MPVRYQHRQGERGFTLAEILVTTAIFAIIMVAALTVYDRSNRVFSSSTSAANLQQSTRIGFEKLVSDLRMAGFDYNRGGIPSGTDQYQQPDEQIEYAGATAIVFRANFDYNTNAARGNGLACDGIAPCTNNYYAKNAGGGNIFPYITTDNTEIVAYVLRSNAPGATNSDSISFYADTDIPRRAYPNVAGHTSNGHAENTVTISGIDVSNNNPPYTLFRVTVDDLTANPPRQGTPVADNIRSLNFTYYSDAIGSTLLTDDAGNPITQTRNAGGATIATTNSGAIGGDGQYDPNAANSAGAGTFADRTQRTLIQSVRVAVVGIEATPTTDYQNPTETNTALKNYREYSLSSLIVPRNLGLQGFPEPSFDPPGKPTITGACTGFCGAPFIAWSKPSSGGPVTSYEVQWDTNPNGRFNCPGVSSCPQINDPTLTSATIPDNNLDPSVTVYYRLVAINDNGPSIPSDNYAIVPKNGTKPKPPTGGTAVSGNNAITLSWFAPLKNQNVVFSCSGTGASLSGANDDLSPQEPIHFRIYRGTTPNFQPPGQGVLVLDFDTASQPANIAPGNPATWTDAAGTGQSLAPPSACINYYYRIQAMDRCFKSTTYNENATTTEAMSDFFPAVGSNAIGPVQATSSSTPSTPTGMTLDPDPSKTSCPPVSGTTCTIGLLWNKVITDTNNNLLAVDTYTLFRERRLQGTTTFLPDLTFGSAGYLDISGFAASAGTLAAYQDTSATYQDLINGVYEYRYSVAAKICNTPSLAYSNTVVYPGCNFTAAVTANGASSGSGTAGDPWVLGYGDSITVTRTSGNILTSATFQYKQAGVNFGTAQTTNGPGPYNFGWLDQPAGPLYEVWITMTDTSGCSMTYVRYITQQPQAACTFQDLGTAGRPGGPPGCASCTCSNSCNFIQTATFDFIYTATASQNYAAWNHEPSKELMLFSIPSGPNAFTGGLAITWADVNGNHPELKLISVDWFRVSSAGVSTLVQNTSISQQLTYTLLAANITTTTQTSIQVTNATTLGPVNSTGTVYIDNEAMTYTVADSTHLTVVRGALGTTKATHTIPTSGNNQQIEVEKVMTTSVTAPSTLQIDVDESLRLKFYFTYDTSHKNGNLNTSNNSNGSDIRNICIKYRVNSDPTKTQSCNLIGRIVTTANPASCD